METPDALFLMISSFTSVWVVYLIWRIDDLKEERDRLRLVRSFVARFLDAAIIQTAVDKRFSIEAQLVDSAVQKSIQFQRNGLIGLDLEKLSDEDNRQRHFDIVKRRIEEDVADAKAVFWGYYDLAESCKYELPVTVRTPRSYKKYLPTHSWQGGIPAEKALKERL